MKSLSNIESESMAIERLRRGVDLGSVRLIALEAPQESASGADGILDATWGAKTQRYVFEQKFRSTPAVIERAVQTVRASSLSSGLAPMVVAPYFSEERLQALSDLGVSGVDFCGNAVLLGDAFSVWRSGAPNRYPDTRPIRNIYRGMSSLVARCFLLRPRFASLTELRDYAASRVFGDGLDVPTKSTASKVVAALDEELIVRRLPGGEIEVIDAAKLLERIRANYRPVIGRRIEGRAEFDIKQICELLKNQKYCASVFVSPLMTPSSKLSLYTPNIQEISEILNIQPTSVFPNIELIKSLDEATYFDTRQKNGEFLASPIQVYLDLMSGGARERNLAYPFETALLDSQGENAL